MAKIQLIKTEFFPLIVIIFAVNFLILCGLLAQFVSWTGVILLFVAFYWICTSKFIRKPQEARVEVQPIGGPPALSNKVLVLKKVM